VQLLPGRMVVLEVLEGAKMLVERFQTVEIVS
jgi:hypothetical protein